TLGPEPPPRANQPTREALHPPEDMSSAEYPSAMKREGTPGACGIPENRFQNQAEPGPNRAGRPETRSRALLHWLKRYVLPAELLLLATTTILPACRSDCQNSAG